MNPEVVSEKVEGEELESLRRDFLNSVFGVLAGLQIHDARNAALQRPFENLEKSILKLTGPLVDRPLEIRLQEEILYVCGERLKSHFSIVEAQKLVMDAMDFAFLESITWKPGVKMEVMAEFFSKLALHISVGGKPRPLAGSWEGLELRLIDPEKLQRRLKNKQLLMSPQYALQRYFLLRMSTQEVFQGIAKNELKSQRSIKRDLLEIAEVGRMAPYNLVALSLIRENADQSNLSLALGQSLPTGLLALAVANELQFSFRDQVNFGLVGLLYNVGLIGEDSGILQKNDKLTPVEYKRILDAQASGVYTLIKMQGAARPTLERLLAIFEHSKGPNVKSVSLTLESRLLRLISQYVALTSDRPFREAYTPFEAVKILGSKAANQPGGELDPMLYYMLVRFLGVYPVGSLVLLSNGEKAVVFRPYGEKMGHPLVKLVPKDPSETSSMLVDLGLESGLSIVKALDPKREGINVSGYFFE